MAHKSTPASVLSSSPSAATPSPAHSGEEIQLTVPWGQISGLCFGPRDGLPVLALHGWLDNANSFLGLAQHLPPGVRMCCVDLPGHGFSSHRPLGAKYTIVDWVQDVELISNALGWKEFALVGHSMGAAIALLYAGTFPEKVSGLCLIDGIVPLQDAEDKARENLRQSILKHAQLGTRPARVEPSLEAALAKLLRSNAALTPAAGEQLLRRGATACDGGYAFTRDLRVRLPSPLRLTERMTSSFIAHVACDVLMVVAEGGLHTIISDRERRQVETLQKAARSFTLVRVPGSHHVHMNEPEVVAPHFVRFLEQQVTVAAKL